jgi:hypothetical protein
MMINDAFKVIHCTPRVTFQIVGWLKERSWVVHIRHQCRKTTALNCHRCLINTGDEKMNNVQNLDLELWPLDVSK